MSNAGLIEVSAPTVEQAVREALEKLGAAEDDVVIEVLATARSGLLGLGSRPARVRVTRRPPPEARSGVATPPPALLTHEASPAGGEPRATAGEATACPAPEESRAGATGKEAAGDGRRTAGRDDQTGEARTILEKILGLMGERAGVEPLAGDPEVIELDIKGDGSGILIGRQGQTLDALEYLLNRIVARRIKDPAPILLDTESYYARRRRQLHRMALSMGERAKRESAAIRLDPMPPRDRRIIHFALKDDPLVTTRSVGEGFLRSVEILPAGGRRERGGHEGKRERRRPSPGEQGGFKRGQKRIV